MAQESLCVQFWDRDTFIDGPVRCLLYNLECAFPFRTVELIRLLSALSKGAWPAECVYNFLDKSVGLTTLVDRRGLEIPRNTRGHVLKVIDDNTALVRWELQSFQAKEMAAKDWTKVTELLSSTNQQAPIFCLRQASIICLSSSS
ncbi:hypothetical protein Tco_1387193 [Tanacetum coccineum]